MKDPQKLQEEMKEAEQEGLITKVNYFLLMIPAFCDFMTSTLFYIALNFIPLSVFEMV